MGWIAFVTINTSDVRSRVVLLFICFGIIMAYVVLNFLISCCRFVVRYVCWPGCYLLVFNTPLPPGTSRDNTNTFSMTLCLCLSVLPWLHWNPLVATRFSSPTFECSKSTHFAFRSKRHFCLKYISITFNFQYKLFFTHYGYALTKV